MHSIQRLMAIAGLLALALAGSLSATHRALAQTAIAGHVYINDNTAGTNTIGAFNRRANGMLVPMPGSPFAAGGAGTSTTFPVGPAPQGPLQLSSDGHYLLAVDAGSNQISVLGIAVDGTLSPVDLVSSGGIEPVSIAVHGDLVYVANEGNGTTGSNYTGFTLSSGGRLTPLKNSTVALSSEAIPGDVLFSPDGSHLAGTEVGTSLIDSFVVKNDGRLKAAPGSPFAAGPGPIGSEFSPTEASHLYVSNAHGGPNNGTVSAFDVATKGDLTSIGASPFPDYQTAPCWVEISHDGQYLFTVNTGSTSISGYQIRADGSLSLLGATTMTNPDPGTAALPFDARLDPTGSFLYVVDAGINAVSAFAVSGGTLTELHSSPTAGPAGATPFGIVVT
jgi:6-phosphogluconolactonase